MRIDSHAFLQRDSWITALIPVAVLLGFINQIIPLHPPATVPIPTSNRSSTELLSDPDRHAGYGTPAERMRAMSSTSVREEMTLGQISHREKMIRAMRLQIWSGAILGGLAAAVVGAVFLFVVRGAVISYDGHCS